MVVYGGTPTSAKAEKVAADGSGARPKGWWKRRPRWLKITVGVVGVLLLLTVSVAAVGAWYLDGVYSSVTKLTTPNDHHTSQHLAKPLPTSDSPLTVLIIGSDHRGKSVAGQYGLSDTLMLMRIDPRHHAAALFSIPRDLWVTVNGYGTGKINGAYSVGGNDLALQAVKTYTGIKPNYLVNIDFSGFRDVVNALGGIYVNVDEHYYNPPSLAPSTGFSAIDIQPGYQLLHGRDALAFSRYRHSDDDFHREARQQVFLRAFQARASSRFNGVSITDLPAIKSLLDTIRGPDGQARFKIIGPGGNAVSVDDLITFIATAYGVRSHIASIHAPFTDVTETDGASAVTIDPTALKQAIYKWKHPWVVATAGRTLPSQKPHKPAKPKWHPAVAPATVQVSVLNGNGVTGDAGKATKQLKAWGYRAHAGGNAPNYKYPDSVVYYKPGGDRAAADLAHIMGTGAAQPIPSNFSGVTRPVVVVVGKSYAGKLAVQPPNAPSKAGGKTPTTITPTSEYRDYFKQAQHQVHFRTVYPTVKQADTEFCPYSLTPPGPGYCSALGPNPIRAYNIPAAGSGLNSMYAMFVMPLSSTNNGGNYWGIEETRFVQAPILENPNAIRKLDGRKYMFYFNGSHIQTIGFVNAGIAYWVQNTLTDELTNGEMIAITRSLKLVG